jgi:hypothetical protein
MKYISVVQVQNIQNQHQSHKAVSNEEVNTRESIVQAGAGF